MHHWPNSLFVMGHVKKKCGKLSRCSVSLSMIRQKLQVTGTVGSMAFSRLFNMRPLVRSKYRKFRKSLLSQLKFQTPKHIFILYSLGTVVPVSIAYVVTVRRVVGSADFSVLRSIILRNFFEPLFMELKKFSMVMVKMV